MNRSYLARLTDVDEAQAATDARLAIAAAAAEVEAEDREIDARLERRRRWAAFLAIGAVLVLVTFVVVAIEQGVLS